MLRTFGIEVLACPQCCGMPRVLAAIHEPGSIAPVLPAMGLSSAVPVQAGCRSPPAGGGVAYVDRVPRSRGGNAAVAGADRIVTHGPRR